MELYTARLARSLRARGHDVRVLCGRVRPGLAQNQLIEESVDEIPTWGLVQNYPYRGLPEAVSDPAIDRVVGQLLDDFAPDLLSVQTLAGLSLGILDEARLRGIPRVVHLHDAWWSCPAGGQRRRPDGGLCNPVDRRLCGPCFAAYQHREGPLERGARWLAGRLPPGVPPDLIHRGFAALPEGAQTLARQANERLGALTNRAAEDSQARTGDDSATLLDPKIALRHEAVRAALEDVDAVLSPSQFMIDSLRRDGLALEGARHLATGVPSSMTPVAPSSGPLRVLFVGTWVPHKGPHVLADALALLRHEERPEVRVAGPAPFPAYRANVLARAQGAMTPLGPLAPDDVRAQMDWTDVVIVPSVWEENAPLVVLEARAAGRAVLASDLGGLSELIQEGRDGYLFPAEDAEALAALLRRGAELRDLEVAPPRSLEDFTDKVLKCYSEVLA